MGRRGKRIVMDFVVGWGLEGIESSVRRRKIEILIMIVYVCRVVN